MSRRGVRAARPAPPLTLAFALVLVLILISSAACERPGNRSVQELYPKHCARCHGADGRGNPVQVGRYPNLDLTRSQARGAGARAFVYRRIAEGYGPMPGFSKKLSRQEIERLADYSLELGAAAPAGR